MVEISESGVGLNEFHIMYTQDHLDTGLRGIPVGHCPTSFVDAVRGLFYVGYTIGDIASKEPEEVIFLLLKKHLPSPEELTEFKQTLVSHSKLDPRVIDGLKAFPKEGHPMKWFVGGLNLMGMFNGRTSYHDDALKVIAQIPELVAAIYRLREGWGEPIQSKPELGYMENFVQMLGLPGDKHPHFEKMMKVFDIIHFDHGGGNLSTFVGKAVASGHEDMYGSLVGAMSGLAGPLHGMANQECLRFLKQVVDGVGGDVTNSEKIQEYIKTLWAGGGKLYGFGHAVLRVEDPRATVGFELGDQICPDDKIFLASKAMRRWGTEFLKKQEKVANPYPNVDGVTGALLHACGLIDEDYYTVLFGMARCVGIAIQIVYEREEARNGKGLPIMRPKYIYNGPRQH